MYARVRECWRPSFSIERDPTARGVACTLVDSPMPLFPPLVEEYDFEETGRGCRCVRDIVQGEELLAIPLDECWTAADARAATQLKPVIDADPELSDVNVTALHLLVERAKGPHSARWAHLQQLPTEYDSTLFWSAQQLQVRFCRPCTGRVSVRSAYAVVLRCRRSRARRGTSSPPALRRKHDRWRRPSQAQFRGRE